jgi:hypothetical protein
MLRMRIDDKLVVSTRDDDKRRMSSWALSVATITSSCALSASEGLQDLSSYSNERDPACCARGMTISWWRMRDNDKKENVILRPER